MISKILKLTEINNREFIGVQLRCMVYILVYTAASLVFPGAVSKVLDEVIIQKKYELGGYYLGIIIISGIVMLVFQYLQYLTYFKFGQKVIIIIRKKLFEKVMSSTTECRKNYSSGDILRMIEQDASQVENLVGSTLGQILVNIIVILSVAILILSMNWIIGIVMVSVSVIFSVVQWRLSGIVKCRSHELRNALGRNSAYTNEAILRFEQLIISGYIKKITYKFNEKNEEIRQGNITQMRLLAISRLIGVLYNIIGNVITLGLGMICVANGHLTVGSLLAISMYVQRLYGPLLTVTDSYVSIKKAVPLIEKIISFIEDINSIENGQFKSDKKLLGEITFKNISFGYDDRVLFKHLDFSIPANKITAIIGENGCGKSTLIKLVMKLNSYQQGSICIDNIDIRDMDNDYLYANVSTMLQNDSLMSGKLKDIINPGGKEISNEELKQLFDRVKLDINKFENGLETIISENNINISGGEVQKLNIIRILIEERPIVILDEPTSAIDNQSEGEICNLLNKLLRGKTVIIITHRKRILEICDHIIELKEQTIK